MEQVVESTQGRRDRLNESVAEMQESLDFLRLSVKYLVFDLEATRRENTYLRRLLDQATIRALAICEGAEALRPVQRYFNLVSARMMFMKAALRSPDVPAEWSDDIRFDDPEILRPSATNAPLEDPQG